MYQLSNLVEKNEFMDRFTEEKKHRKVDVDPVQEPPRKQRRKLKPKKVLAGSFHLQVLNAQQNIGELTNKASKLPSFFPSFDAAHVMMKPLIVYEAAFIVGETRRKAKKAASAMRMKVALESVDEKSSQYKFKLKTHNLPVAWTRSSSVFVLYFQGSGEDGVPALVASCNSSQDSFLVLDMLLSSSEYDALHSSSMIEAVFGDTSLISNARMFRCNVPQLSYSSQILGSEERKSATHLIFSDSDESDHQEDPVEEIGQDMLMCSKQHCFEVEDVMVESIFRQLNPSQQGAIASAFDETHSKSVHLWQGPPGTGKTRTISGFLQIVARNNVINSHVKKVIICAPSNQAVKVVLERFLCDLAANKMPIPPIALAGVVDIVNDTSRDYYIHDASKHFFSQLRNLVNACRKDLENSLSPILVLVSKLQIRIPSLKQKLNAALDAIQMLKNISKKEVLRLKGGAEKLLSKEIQLSWIKSHSKQVYKIMKKHNCIQLPIHGPCSQVPTANYIWMRPGFKTMRMEQASGRSRKTVVKTKTGKPGTWNVDFFLSEDDVAEYFFCLPEWQSQYPTAADEINRVFIRDTSNKKKWDGSDDESDSSINQPVTSSGRVITTHMPVKQKVHETKMPVDRSPKRTSPSPKSTKKIVPSKLYADTDSSSEEDYTPVIKPNSKSNPLDLGSVSDTSDSSDSGIIDGGDGDQTKGKTESITDWLNRLAAILEAVENECDSRVVESNLIQTAEFIFCTLAVSGRAAMLRANLKIDFVVVDEAAQSVEAETWIALQFQPRNIILVGDPKQLNATIIAPASAINGFQRSMMDRLMYDLKYPFILLDTQYRMHPSISRFSNLQYYESQLKDSSDVLNRKGVLDIPPYLFWDVENGREERSSRSLSTSNIDEAMAICNVISLWSRKGVNVAKLVIVITFYQEQVISIRLLLKKYGISGVMVSTVDSYQGCESDIVFLSFVRANPKHDIGFLRDSRRLNVSLTRAKHCLYMFGNYNTLKYSKKKSGEKSDVAVLVQSAKDLKCFRSYEHSAKNNKLDLF